MRCTHFQWNWTAVLLLTVTLSSVAAPVAAGSAGRPVDSIRSTDQSITPLHRARMFLAAGDFRRAIVACQEEVAARPSAESYVYLTYAYQALHGYMEYQAAQDRWVLIQQLVRNLSGDRPEVLIDPPDILPRIAKEIISDSIQRESDVVAAMATRLNKGSTESLWQQQKAWRTTHPQSWWHGVPEEWAW